MEKLIKNIRSLFLVNDFISEILPYYIVIISRF